MTSIVVKLAPGTRPSTAEQRIATQFPGLLVISDPDEALRAGANGQLIAKIDLVIVVLALLIGGIGVMNTMLMSVIERRTEFALLSAVGWSGPQVAGLVLAEGLIVSILGAAFGVLIGWAGARLLDPRARRPGVRLPRRDRLGARTGAADRDPDRRARRDLPRLAGGPSVAGPGAGPGVVRDRVPSAGGYGSAGAACTDVKAGTG